MGMCTNHPDRETHYVCMKHQVYLCEECLACSDAKFYCKFRSSCTIWFMSKRQEGLDNGPLLPPESPPATKRGEELRE